MRLLQAILGAAASWASLLLHKGLYSPAAVIVAYIVAALWYLTGRRRLLRTLFRTAAPATALSWRTEVWGFQWKIALTFLSSYFTVQVLTPIIFASRGPVEAGRLGMSLSISGYLWSLVFTWMSTKATPFGQFVARRDFAGLDELFFRTFRRALAVIVAIAAVGMAVMLALQAIAPSIATRMVAPGSFGLLLLGAIGIFVVQCEAVYLRAHKEEPLMWQAVLVAVLTSCGAYVAAPRWGVSGIAWVYFLCSGAIGPILATIIFRQKRRSKSPDMELPELERLPLEAMP